MKPYRVPVDWDANMTAQDKREATLRYIEWRLEDIERLKKLCAHDIAQIEAEIEEERKELRSMP